MKIIKEGVIPREFMRLTCDYCHTVFEFEKYESIETSQLGVMHDGLPSYNIKCPLCKQTIYFNWGK